MKGDHFSYDPITALANDQRSGAQNLREFWEDWDFEPGSVGDQMIREAQEQTLRRNVLAMQESGFSGAEIARILKLERSLVENILRSNP